MKSFLLVLFIIISGCSSDVKDNNPLELDVFEAAPNKKSALARQNLMHLTRVYDLEPLLFTKKINIQTGAIPTSHPVLTLNTRYAEQPKKILSALLYEELHWWLLKNQDNLNLAIRDLKKIYPRPPVTKGKENLTHLNLIVCYLEMKALSFYLGEKEARKIISSFMKVEKKRIWVYYQILNKDFAIKKIVEKYNLLPPPLS